MKRVIVPVLLLGGLVNLPFTSAATDPPPPIIWDFTSAGAQKNLRVTPYPAAQAYTFYSATNLSSPFAVDSNFFLAPYITGLTIIPYTTSNGPAIITVTNYAYEWRNTNSPAPSAFYRVGVTPLSSNALLTANVLNRLAYGPTPDELERVTAMGAQAYIDEQLNMDGIPDLSDNYTVETINAVPSDPTTNWTYITMTGTVASTTFYLFTTQPGDVFVDDIELRPFKYYRGPVVTNTVNGTNVVVTNSVFSHIGTNVLINGGFESALSPWTKAGGAVGSDIAPGVAHSGSSSLHVVSTTGSSTTGPGYVRQIFPNSYATTNLNGNTVTNIHASTNPVVLSYWYLPSAHSTKLRLQLGGGLNSTPGGIPPAPTWVYATATGTATAISQFYIYLNGAGDCYVDDVKLVAGSVPEAGPNLLQNGDFESPLAGTWTNSADFVNSALSSTIAHSGNSSLHVVASNAGAGAGDAVQQNITPPVVNGQTYTVSYWYLPAAPNRTLTVRLSGSLLTSTPDTDTAGLYRRLNTLRQNDIGECRAWFCLHAVNSPRQLFEILAQFWENHFVTQYAKSRTYIDDNLGYESVPAAVLATDWEFREMKKWRNAMLNPNCTFYDLLRISAESPAMIVYLDTVGSRADGTRIANENYARELLELFTCGVDNGYEQNDIILMSRAWSGWSIELVDAVNANNPFAPASITYQPGTNSTGRANTVGVWAFNFKPGFHGATTSPLFAGKTVPARFGPPWAGRPYQLALPNRPTGSTNAIMDGYDAITHLANLPFTAEYLSIKLCRLFVHDDFPNPTTRPELPEYAFYNYTNPDRSAEAELVHQCMLAWENSSPKGNLRAVLATILNSDLFRSHAAAGHKVKNPLEFVASSVRALRSVNANGTATASTDGFSFATRLSNMGGMGLFDRAEPDGYPEAGPPWISAGTLVERIRYTQAYLTAGTGGDAGNDVCDPVGLLKKKLPAGSWNNAGDVASYFLSILYPGEGAGNLSLYRTAAMNYLNDGSLDSPVSATPFSGVINTTTNYDTRVRGMVSMLMTFQRFQEQ